MTEQEMKIQKALGVATYVKFLGLKPHGVCSLEFLHQMFKYKNHYGMIINTYPESKEFLIEFEDKERIILHNNEIEII